MKKIVFITICVMTTLFFACEEPETLNKVETREAAVITRNSAILHGVVTIDNSQNNNARFGIIISDSPINPNDRQGIEYNAIALLGNEFSVQVTDLVPATKYYYCAWLLLDNTQYEYGDIKEFETLAPNLAIVNTLTVMEITVNSATVYGNISDDGGASVIERGVVYDLSQEPTTSCNKVTSGSGIGSFSCNLSDLKAGCTYYIRAYAVNDKGTAYGEEISFTTTPTIGFENGHQYIDLGLSTKWATCNVGAKQPEDYGNYFAWGENKIKNDYSHLTYSYNPNPIPVILPLHYDAAHLNWGGTWRMPTNMELTELREQCTWEWTTLEGVNGYIVTATKSGYTNNSIFLPAAGYYLDHSLVEVGNSGYYWSSSLVMDEIQYARNIFFSPEGTSKSKTYRHIGLTVRPVCP